MSAPDDSRPSANRGRPSPEEVLRARIVDAEHRLGAVEDSLRNLRTGLLGQSEFPGSGELPKLAQQIAVIRDSIDDIPELVQQAITTGKVRTQATAFQRSIKWIAGVAGTVIAAIILTVALASLHLGGGGAPVTPPATPTAAPTPVQIVPGVSP